MRRIFAAIGILALAWAVGLLVFIRELPAPASGAGAKADGVVVYTGIGGARVATGMSLMQSGAGARLLISGVNPNTTREEVAKQWEGDLDGFDCCVDLGLEAQSTAGNAHEVRDWANSHGFRSLILVTSDYHMPRALLETRTQLPEAEIIAHPVESGYLDASGKPKNLGAWRQLAYEYTKFLAVRVRTLAS